MMKLFFWSIVVVVSITSFGLGAFFFLTHVPWVDLSMLEHYEPGKPSIVLDDEGKEWARFQIDQRKPVALSQMPKHLINAFVAAEDHTFFSHKGISIRGIVRSTLVNVIRGKRVQGASTITQQLVRLLYFDQQKTFHRKIKEQILSLAVERQCTKELILETYLNHIYFGCGIYGVEAASQRFWAKHVQELTLEESASLAAIIPSPARYCPLLNPELNRVRRDAILNALCQLDYISQEACSSAKKVPVTIQKQDRGCAFAPHAKEHIRLFLENLVGRKELYTGGLVIQTTLNSTMQKVAEEKFTKHVRKIKKTLSPTVDGALLALAVSDSAVKAMVGGYDFASSQFNRALNAYRQMGSIFKPLVYGAALEERCIEFDDIAVDEPVTIVDGDRTWTPRNFNEKCEGAMTLAQALAVSKNTIAIKTLLNVGIDKVIGYARKFRLSPSLVPYPSLALGCVDATALAVATMFNVFAHKGIYTEPYFIVWIKDAWGKKIWKHKELNEPIISWSTSSKVAQVLSASLERFKQKHPDQWDDTAAFGKTGTTNQSRTCWFAGSTPSFTTVVYVGNDNNQPLGKDVYPSSTAFPLWLEFNRTIEQPLKKFAFDPALVPLLIDPWTGQPLQANGDHKHPLCILVDRGQRNQASVNFSQL